MKMTLDCLFFWIIHTVMSVSLTQELTLLQHTVSSCCGGQGSKEMDWKMISLLFSTF